MTVLKKYVNKNEFERLKTLIKVPTIMNWEFPATQRLELDLGDIIIQIIYDCQDDFDLSDKSEDEYEEVNK